MAASQREAKTPSRNILLPGEDYVLLKWLVRDGSAVRTGDTLAIAIPRAHATSSLSTAESSSATTTHKRPKKRKRVTEQQQGHSDESKMATIAPQQPQHHAAVSIVAPAAGLLRSGSYSASTTVFTNPLQIGYIEPCLHPAIMGGLCAVCGESIGPAKVQSAAAAPFTLKSPPAPTMSQVTVSGGVTMTVSESEAQQMSVQNSKRLSQQRKLSLVLDLDHTLVHATADVRARADYLSRDDVRTLILPIVMEGTQQVVWMQHYVKLRPHIKEFLTQAQPLYEISVYTAGTRQYAEHVTMVLSRCVVGSTRDDEDMQRLRHSVMRAEHELNSATAKDKKDNPNDADKKESTNDADKKESTNDASEKDSPPKQPQHNEANGEAKESKGKDEASPKRKVTFGEPPAASKTDTMTPEKLEELKKELRDAELLEQKALEVRQSLFGSRIVSRTDVGDLGRDVKSLERIFPGGGSMAVIVDDREDVWANAQDNSKRKGEPPENLLLVRPYHWKPFVGYADVNNAAGVDISGEATTTADEADCQLLWTLDVLKRTHKRFYSSAEKRRNLTVPVVLKEMRHKVLPDCTLLFSGLVPLHHQRVATDRPRPAVVRYGESLGAKLSETVTNSVTHVVAARDGTDKILRARRVPGCVIVKASWLMECVWTITRRDVKPHLLGQPSKASAMKPIKPAPVAKAAPSTSSSSSDEDDDFAAELEADLME